MMCFLSSLWTYTNNIWEREQWERMRFEALCNQCYLNYEPWLVDKMDKKRAVLSQVIILTLWIYQFFISIWLKKIKKLNIDGRIKQQQNFNINSMAILKPHTGI